MDFYGTTFTFQPLTPQCTASQTDRRTDTVLCQ